MKKHCKKTYGELLIDSDEEIGSYPIPTHELFNKVFQCSP